MLLSYLEQAVLYNSINFTDVPLRLGRLGSVDRLQSVEQHGPGSLALRFSSVLRTPRALCPGTTTVLVPGRCRRDTGVLAPGGDGAFPLTVRVLGGPVLRRPQPDGRFQRASHGSGDDDAVPSARDVNFRDRSVRVTASSPDADQFMTICASGSGPAVGFVQSGHYWLDSTIRRRPLQPCDGPECHCRRLHNRPAGQSSGPRSDLGEEPTPGRSEFAAHGWECPIHQEFRCLAGVEGLGDEGRRRGGQLRAVLRNRSSGLLTAGAGDRKSLTIPMQRPGRRCCIFRVIGSIIGV